jgi:hypothetical protein
VFVEQGLHVVGQVIGQRHLDEDQRLGRHARVEEGVEAAVGIEAVLEVGQERISCTASYSINFSSSEAGECQVMRCNSRKADVEPGAQARLQFAVEHGQSLSCSR